MTIVKISEDMYQRGIEFFRSTKHLSVNQAIHYLLRKEISYAQFMLNHAATADPDLDVSLYQDLIEHQLAG